MLQTKSRLKMKVLTATLLSLTLSVATQNSWAAGETTSSATTSSSSTTPVAAPTYSSSSTGSGNPIGSPVGGSADIYLPLITKATQETVQVLQVLNNLPAYLSVLAQMAIAWVSPDTSETTATLQNNFATYASKTAESTAAQKALQPQLLQDLFKNVTIDNLPYANDLAFQTLLGMPVFTPDPRQGVDPIYNYIKNAGGVNISHRVPGTNWKGNQANQLKYLGFYMGVTSIESFDSYIISKIATDMKTGVPAAQASLIQQASSSDWFSTVASEQIGIVLRQILMYNSQTYVLLSQLLETQKQQLLAQAMSNTLLILSAQGSEELLLRAANGTLPGSTQ